MSLQKQDQPWSATEEPLLEVDSISVEFTQKGLPVRALRDVSLTIHSGETVGIAGESGSGKSTLAKAILRYLDENGSITSGLIEFKGENLEQKSGRELRSIRGNQVAHVAQNPETALNPSMRIGEQIKEVIRLHRDPADDAAATEQVHEVLDRVNIPDPAQTARQYPHQLSGGMQQRALIAISLSCNPDLLILDEPTTGLDVTTQAKILDLVEELKDQYQMSILLISHNLAVISNIADRVGILYAGEIMEWGTVEAVFTEPSNPYTQGLLAAIPLLDEDREFIPIPGQIPDLTDIPEGCIFADRCTFATEECTQHRIDLQSVENGDGHKSRCIHWETARNDPIQPTTAEPQPYDPGEKLFEAKDVKKHFGETRFLDRFFSETSSVKAVDGMSLEIFESETVGLVGESGCGKSTFGKVLLNLLDPTNGTVSFRGQDIHEFDGDEMRSFRSECQVIFQSPDSSLNGRKRVHEILDRPLKLFTDLDQAERRERIVELLEQVNLPVSMASKFPHELSGGEKQRIAIARAFAANPSFVVLDEPVSSLDVSVQANILNLLQDLREQYDTSYLFISHDLSVVRAICDRIAVMYLGDIVEIGLKEDIFNPPHHPYTRSLLSSAPHLDPERQAGRIRLEGDVPSARDPPSGCPFHTRCPQKIGAECEENPPSLEEVTDAASHEISCHLDEHEMTQESEEIADHQPD